MKFIVIAMVAIVSYSSCAREANDSNNADNIKKSFDLVDSANKLVVQYGDDSTSL